MRLVCCIHCQFDQFDWIVKTPSCPARLVRWTLMLGSKQHHSHFVGPWMAMTNQVSQLGRF